jgi:hypothetical protein
MPSLREPRLCGSHEKNDNVDADLRVGAKAIKCTVAQNRVVLVDPITMRVVDVISQH